MHLLAGNSTSASGGAGLEWLYAVGLIAVAAAALWGAMNLRRWRK